jgi:hypothetical protein
MVCDAVYKVRGELSDNTEYVYVVEQWYVDADSTGGIEFYGEALGVQ